MTVAKRRFTTILAILFALSMMLSAFTINADAAVNIKKVTPKFVTGSCYYANGSTCKAVLKWKKVKGATKYIVYRSATKSGKYKKFATTKKTSIKKKSKGEFYYKVRAISGKKKSKLSKPVHLFPARGQIVNKMYISMGFGTKTTLWVVVGNDSKKMITLPASNASYSICLVKKSSGKVIKEYAVNNVEDYMNGTPATIAKGQDNSSDVLVLAAPGTISPGEGEEIVAKIKFKAGGKTFTLKVKEDSTFSSTVSAITK